MILSTAEIAYELETSPYAKDPMVITPRPDLEQLRQSGAASVDIRLGCWFLTCRPSRTGILDVYKRGANAPNEHKLTKSYYVPFGKEFLIHPDAFVLGVTLEWIRLPKNRAAYVIGRSSWGRYGLIIATATGVHPGFTGCLTLELSNVGEIPINVKPGLTICQIFIHDASPGNPMVTDKSHFVGRRKPSLRTIEPDEIAEKLGRESESEEEDEKRS